MFHLHLFDNLAFAYLLKKYYSKIENLAKMHDHSIIFFPKDFEFSLVYKEISKRLIKYMRALRQAQPFRL